jgi:hypothetical protein
MWAWGWVGKFASRKFSNILCRCVLTDCIVLILYWHAGFRGDQLTGIADNGVGQVERPSSQTALETTLRLVASVHDDMQMILDAPGAEQILGRGQGWSSLPSGDSSKGSRLEKVVARLSRCGITIGMQARRSVQGGERPEPCQRGPTRPPQKRRAMIPAMFVAGVSTYGLDAVWPEGAQGLENATGVRMGE